MGPETLVQAVARKQAEAASVEQAKAQAEKDFTVAQFKAVAQSVMQATALLVDYLPKLEPKVEVKNFPKQESDKEVVKAVKNLEKSLKPQKFDNKDVIAAVKQLDASIKSIPGLMPQPEAVDMTQVVDMVKTLSEGQKKLTEALNKLEMSPKITVPKPVVTVQPTDVKGLIKVMKEVKQEVIDKPVPGTPTFVQDPLIRFTPANMDDSGDIEYYSYIASDGEFYIRKVDGSGTYKTIRFYFGKGTAATHDTAWTARAGLTYTMWTT